MRGPVGACGGRPYAVRGAPGAGGGTGARPAPPSCSGRLEIRSAGRVAPNLPDRPAGGVIGPRDKLTGAPAGGQAVAAATSSCRDRDGHPDGNRPPPRLGGPGSGRRQPAGGGTGAGRTGERRVREERESPWAAGP